jgi:hypothetical protein
LGRAHPPVDLGCDNDFVPPDEILDRPPEDFLAITERIPVSGIEEINVCFERLMNGRLFSSLSDHAWLP